jgi:predicted Zn-dependent peptidase
MTTTKTYAFPNGFRVVYQKNNSNSKSTSIQLFCKLGSVHEYDSMRGVSHFIEHMCFTPFHISNAVYRTNKILFF